MNKLSFSIGFLLTLLILSLSVIQLLICLHLQNALLIGLAALNVVLATVFWWYVTRIGISLYREQ